MAEKSTHIDLSQMSEKELKALISGANQVLADIEAERQARLERKRLYALRRPEPTYTFLYHAFYEHVMKLGESDPDLLVRLREIEKRCRHRKIDKNEEIYPCPECGEMSLYPGNYGNGEWSPQYRITCGCCEFTAPVKKQSCEYDAWEKFYEWLVKEGYLDSETRGEG